MAANAFVVVISQHKQAPIACCLNPFYEIFEGIVLIDAGIPG
jgi:hypothetical protein